MSYEFTQVETDHCTVWLGDPELDWPEYRFDHVALEPHPPTGLYLFTGLHTGIIGVRLAVHDSEPALDTTAWPHTETVTLELASTEFHTIPLGGGGDIAEVTLPRPGRYNVRAAWDTRLEPHAESDDGEEKYLIDIWPAS